MAENREEPSRSMDNCDEIEASTTPKPTRNVSPEGSEAEYSRDLRSVLVTSVLNLETLDLDLYR